MITVGCAGFAVPATRYFKEYRFVEIQETHLAVPGQGTLRRWQREAPTGFDFALLGPREVGQEAFRDGSVLETALAGLRGVAGELKARTVVFLAPQDFAQNRANKSALKAFLASAKGVFGGVVFDAGPNWKPDDADSLAEDTGTIAVRDPLQQGLSRRIACSGGGWAILGQHSARDQSSSDRLRLLGRSQAEYESKGHSPVRPQ